VIRCILSDFGYVDAPVEGCPTRDGDSETERISQITAGVLHQLKQRGVL
jgi:hypothetical protein